MNAIVDFISLHWVVVVQSVFIASLLMILWVYLPMIWGAPWIPTPLRVVRKMLALAEIKPGQTVIDLGSGDGRVVILAARKYKARAIGVEIDPLRVLIVHAAIRILGVNNLAKIYWGDLRRFKITDADAVILCLLQGTNDTLRNLLPSSLRPGTKVISHLYSMSGWTPVALDDRNGIFVYEIGNTGDDVQTRFV